MYSIEDVNSRTILQQFHALYENQKETNETVEDIQTDLAQEIQDRTNADSELADSISSLQNQLDSLGTIFTLKGSVATVGDLPQTDNHVGDVYYVVSESTGYIWIDDNGTERWEQLGISVDLSNYVTNDDLSTALAGKQNKLIAGTNVSIIGDTISATQPDTTKFEMLSGVSAPSTTTIGAVGQKYLDTTKNDVYICTAIIDNGDDTFSYTWLLEGGAGKQNKLTAGTNITISGDVISASGGASNVKASDIDSESATQDTVLTADGNGGAGFVLKPISVNNSRTHTVSQKILLRNDSSINSLVYMSRYLSNGYSSAPTQYPVKYIQIAPDPITNEYAPSNMTGIKVHCKTSTNKYRYSNLNDESIRFFTTDNYEFIISPSPDDTATSIKNIYVRLKLPQEHSSIYNYATIAYDEDLIKYRHHIMISDSTANAQICMTILTKTNTAFTYATLLSYFQTVFSALTDKIAMSCSGMETGRNVAIWRVGTDGTNICGFSDQIVTFAESTTTLTDTVETIS